MNDSEDIKKDVEMLYIQAQQATTLSDFVKKKKKKIGTHSHCVLPLEVWQLNFRAK